MSGPEVPGYEGLEVLGRGGFATVYRARQVAVGRDVALKVLDGASTDPRSIELFTRECTAVGSLSWHPHVVPVYDAGRTPAGLAYLSMELFPGGSLGDRLEREGPLPPAEALRHAADVADALAAAHEIDVLHRDVKPANVLVDRRGRARLADFGIARVAGAQTTATGAVTGTISYIAPEVLAGGRATAASDVWALGLTLAALLTGRNPLVLDTDDTPFAIIARIVGGPTETVPAGLPEPVAEVISMCTARDPAVRPTAAEAHQLLTALADAADAGALEVPPDLVRTQPSGPPPPTPPRPADRPSPPGFPAPPTSAVRVRADHTLAEPPPPPSAPPGAPPAGGDTTRPLGPGPSPGPSSDRPRRTGPVLAGVALLVVLAAIAAAVVLLGGDDEPAGDDQASPTTADLGDLPLVEAGVLTVCAPDARPFSYVEDGEATGFDVDLLAAMAETMDLGLALADSDAVFDGPARGACDVAAGAWTITSERDQEVDFTTPYLDVDQGLLVRSDSGLDEDTDLGGLTIGVVEGSTGAAFVADQLDVGDSVPSSTFDELLAAVATGEVDAAVHDEPFGEDAAFRDDTFAVAATYPTGEQLGFVVADDSTALVDALDAALVQVRDDGTYEEIRAGYFGG